MPTITGRRFRRPPMRPQKTAAMLLAAVLLAWVAWCLFWMISGPPA
jgi:dolichol kinase